jgi:hypothetical protein
MPLKKKRRIVKKRVVKKRPARKAKLKIKRKAKKPIKKPMRVKKAKENILGIITHYFPKVRAAVVKLKGPLAIGDTLKIKGHTTDFKQNVASIQIDRAPITSAKKGQEIGLLVDSRARRNDVVYKV